MVLSLATSDPIRYAASDRDFGGRFSVPSYDLSKVKPDSHEFYFELNQLIRDIASGEVVNIAPSTRKIVERLSLMEWSEPYPADLIPVEGASYFENDRSLHNQYTRLSKDLQVSRLLRGLVERAQSEDAAKEALDAESKLPSALTLEQQIDKVAALIRLNVKSVGYDLGAAVRFTHFGKAFAQFLDELPRHQAELAVKIYARYSDAHQHNYVFDLLTHMQALVALRDVDLHLRKLNMAMLQKNVDPSPLYFRTRTRQVTAEHHTDIYLADPTTDTGKQSASWLRKVDGGCYCPMPYPSWQAEARDKAYADARRLVVRARRASHQVFNRLRWEARHVAGTAPLFNEFVRENFDDVMYLKGNNIDMPPGRGFIASGPRTDKLFFRRDHIQEDGLSRFQASSKAWFKDALSGFEGLSLIVTREWIGVFSRCPEMELFGEVYPYLIENGHFSSFYNHAYAFPLATVVKGIRRTMYDPAVGPTPETKDLAHEPSSIARMLLRTRGPSVAKPGLVLGTMSQLFGGMCNALPVGWAPTFAWEKGRSGDVWKDAYQHVHWSWLVWTDRDNREFVDRSVTPLRAAHEQIAAYTDFSQKLLASVFDRYAAWKSDLTPGERTAPRLLTRAYEIYRGYQRNDPSLPKDEVAYIAAYSRNDPDARPIPLLNCANLQLLVDGKSIQLPTSSDGTENAESSLWRRHVLPYTLSQDREGLQGEGEYYLALVGEKDL